MLLHQFKSLSAHKPIVLQHYSLEIHNWKPHHVIHESLMWLCILTSQRNTVLFEWVWRAGRLPYAKVILKLEKGIDIKLFWTILHVLWLQWVIACISLPPNSNSSFVFHYRCFTASSCSAVLADEDWLLLDAKLVNDICHPAMCVVCIHCVKSECILPCPIQQQQQTILNPKPWSQK